MERLHRASNTLVLVSGIWLATLHAIAAQAAEWTAYDLPGIAFSVPSDWEMTYSRRDVEYDFESPDGTFKLWVRWWYPDEPLIGYDDIVFQDMTTIAGQNALLVRHESAVARTLQIALPDHKNADGEIVLIQLLAPIDLSIANHELFMRAMAQKLFIDGQPAKLRGTTPFGGDLRDDGAAADVPSQAPVAPAEPPGASPQGAATGYHYAANADFSLPQPAGWQVHTAQGNGVSQVAVVPPERNAMVLAIVGTQADTDMAMGYLYRDSIVTKSIEGETYSTIAGLPAHALEIIAKVYAINAIALPYARGRVVIYRGGTTERYFIIITIRPEDAPKALTNTLAAVAGGFVFGPPPETAVDPAVSPPSSGTKIPIIPLGQPTEATPETLWREVIETRFGADCRYLDLAEWSHPTRPVIEESGTKLAFVALCRDDTYPVFGVRFPYDPRAATDDFFYPLYGQTYLANGRWDFSFLEVDDGLLISLAAQGEGLGLDIEELPLPELAPAQIVPDLSVSPKVAAGMKSPDAPAPNPEAPVEETPLGGPTVLFDGMSLDGWDPISFYGGEFERDARLGPDALAVKIPADMGWALVGLVSQEPRVAMPARDAQDAPMLAVKLDLGASDGLLLAFVDADERSLEPWNKYDLRLHAFLGQDGLGHYRLDRAGDHAVVTDGPWPAGGKAEDFTVTLRPDGILMLRNGSGSELLRAEVPADLIGKPWYLRVYTRPAGKSQAAALTLRRLTMDRVAPKAEPDANGIATQPVEAVLFDGSGMGTLWQRYEAYKNYFRHYATVDGALVIHREPETDDVRLGLMSAQPVLWLDRFTGDAQATLRFELDGKRSSGLDLTLSQRVGYDNQGQSAFRLWFERDLQTGTVKLRTLSPQAREPVVVPGLADIPDAFALVLTPGRIRIEIDNVAPIELPFKAAQDGAGLRLYVLGRNLPGSDETDLVLHRITAARLPGPVPEPASPRPGVKLLPTRELLDVADRTAWLRHAPGGLDFEALSQDLPQGIRLFREEEPGNGNRIALISAEPVIETDARIARTPLVVTLHLDPDEETLAGRVVFTQGTNPDKGVEHEILVEDVQDGPNAGRLKLRLLTDHFSYYRWERLLPKGWQQETWDGSMRVALGDEVIRITLGARDGNDVSMTAQTGTSGADQLLHIGVMPGTQDKYASGGISLLGIEAGWLTPEGMDELSRQTLLDTDAFSADDYLSGLKILIDEEIGQ